ncbi:PREDICTED: uncharacterized protein LOC109477729 [Branchiostoma belcheri]|uniref:Uncharacterized protein LOC109477729 n=1 Tax=Branchiostoma belcheri TaxID=7741 RepID=A0A6P4ZKX3_BRABE|nr:PREDICTED: uncharacterized protein LOC109477729 [Branchiostoma belcheri]
MFKLVVFITMLVIPYLQRTVADCTDSYFVPDPVFVGCYQKTPSQADPFLPYEIQTAVFNASNCVSCCAAENQSFNFAGVVTRPNGQVRCLCGQRSENYYDSISNHHATGCLTCPGNSGQSCGDHARVSVYEVNTSVETTHLTTRPNVMSSISSTIDNMGASRENTAFIAGSAGGGAAVLLVVCGVVAVIIIRKRSSTSKKNNLPSASISLRDVGGGNPDDPSYQDVLPSGAQHQYATVREDPHPYTAVRDEPNVYESIQDDPQYAIVQKGRKHMHAPNAETNTAYDSESPPSNDDDRSPSVCEMVDNIIYE